MQYTIDNTGLLVCVGNCAYLLDSISLQIINSYLMDTLLRCAILLPTNGSFPSAENDNLSAVSLPVIVAGGGMDPKHAATKDTSVDEFRIQFFDALSKDSKQLGKLDGHRGTIHCISCTRDGLHMASGCEDSGVLLITIEAK